MKRERLTHSKTLQTGKNLGFFQFVLSRPALFLGLAIFVYILAISLLHALRLSHFMNGFDMAFYQQAIWNTSQGRFLEVSATDFSQSLLGTDVILIYALMTPFYMLVPSALTLVVVETVVVAAGALPIYWLARDRLQNGWAGVAFAILYLLLPAVENGNLYELRERPMAGAFLLFAFYFWQKGQLGWFGLAAVLALACRPENGLVLAMLGLYGWLEGRQRQAGFGWHYIWGPVGLGLGWLGAALLVIQLATGGNGYALGSTFAGGSPLAAVTTLFTNPAQGWQQLFPTGSVLLGKLLYIPLLLLPFAFLPLFSPRLLLLALPPVGLNLLANEKRRLQWNPFDYHYQSSVMPWLLIATLFAVVRLRTQPPKWLPQFKKLTVGLVGLTLALTLTLNIGLNLANYDDESGVPKVRHGWGPILRAKESARWEEGKTLLKIVPDDAPVAVSNVWAVYLTPRRGLWYFADRPLYSRHPARDAQYVFADLRVPEEAQLARQLLDSGEWLDAGQRAEYLLLKKG